MARLRVGDILIEDGRVGFGVAAPRPARSVTPAARGSEPSSTLDRIPGTPGLLSSLGGLSLVVGLASVWLGRAVYTALPVDATALAWLVVGVPAVTAGLGLLALGAAKHLSAPRALAVDRGDEVAPDLFEARLARLEPILRLAGPDNTFERLLAESGLTERALLDTLVAAERSGRIEEELDLETGEWFFQLGVRPRLADPRDASQTLDERLRAFQARNKEKSR